VQWIALILTVIVLALLVIRKPFWLVPLLGVAAALEISKTWYPDLGLIGQLIGTVTLTRLTCIALIFAAFSRLLFSEELRQRFSGLAKDPLTIVLLVYLLLGAVSVFYSADPGKTVIETIRLVTLFLVFVSIVLLSPKDQMLIPIQAVHITALLLTPLTLYEAFSGNLIWQGEILLKEHILRVNATFVDPNIFARFIILGIVANFVLQLYTGQRKARLVYLACLAVLLAELLMTSSRGGVLTLAAILLATLIFLPNKKAVLWVIGLGVLCGAIVLFLRPDIWERMTSLTQGFAVANAQRLYLWKAAVAIFQDNLIAGTGLGSFQTVFLKNFSDILTGFNNGATLSHTTILTIAAELGILGLIVLTALWLVLFGKLHMLYIRSNHKGNYLLNIFDDSSSEYFVGAGYFLWILTIFISSQGEGRFFEDPIFWMSCAFLVLLKLGRR